MWICEKHPWLDWPHNDCPGPGMPASNVPRLVHTFSDEQLLLACVVLDHYDTRAEWRAVYDEIERRQS